MATPVSFGSILKVVQDSGTDITDLLRKSPLLLNTTHQQDFHAEEIRWSVPYAGLGGGSYTAATAESNDVNSEFLRFRVTPKTVYSQRTVNGLLTRQAISGDVSEQYIDYLMSETRMAKEVCVNTVAANAHRSITLSLGRRQGASTNVITLTRKSDVYLFNKGDIVGASSADGSGTRTGTTAVASRDPSAGTITLVSAAAITSFADNDYLFVSGNQNQGMFGLESYNPATSPTSGDSVFGSLADRSVDPEATAGVRFDASAYSKATCMIAFGAYMQRTPGYDGTAGMLYCHSDDIADIQIALESSRFINSDNEYGIGVSALRCGSVEFTQDPFAVKGTARYVPKGAGFKLRSNNGFGVDEADGNTVRKTSGDTYKLMALIDANFTCEYPGKLGQFTWPAA